MKKYADWLTKEQAAKAIGKSVKTVERLANAREFEKQYRDGHAVFNPRDVQREASKQSPADLPFVMPEESEETGVSVNPAQNIIPAQQNFIDALRTMLETTVPKLLPPPPAKDPKIIVPPAQKSRVTLREAVALGYNADDLIARVKGGSLENVHVTPHRYRFRRRDLDAL